MNDNTNFLCFNVIPINNHAGNLIIFSQFLIQIRYCNEKIFCNEAYDDDDDDNKKVLWNMYASLFLQ